jgi:PAS domain S-box-containing protein
MNTIGLTVAHRTEEALSKRLGSGEILDRLPIGVYCCDQHGFLVQYNQSAAELWGRQPELGVTRFGGAQNLFTLSGDPLPHEQSPMAEALRSGEAVRNRRVVISRPDGHRLTVLVSADPLFEADGTLVGAVNCFQNVTELRQAAEELQRSKDDLEDFFENGAVGLHVVGSDGTILRANKAELDMLGYSSSEYVGRHVADFHIDQPVIGDILAKLARGEPLNRCPARLRAKDGSVRHVLITSNARFQDGKFVKTRCFTFDVTEAKLADERVHEGEKRFREILEALPAAIYTTDAQGKITFYNQAAVDLAGRTPELGSDAWCVSWRLYSPDGAPLPHDQCPMAIALKEKRANRGAEAIAERPDGSRVRFQPYPTPLFDRQGRLTGAVNMLVDITDRHRAEEQSALLAAIVASSDDAIVSKTLEGRITSWNAAATRIFGYQAEEMVGQSIKRIIPLELHGEEDHILAQLRRGERIEHFDTQRVTKNGDRVDVSLTVSPLRDKSGKIIGASKVGRDVTQRKQADKLHALLLEELSHRVKNTLATVQSIANQTVHLARSPGEFAESFSGRLQALARTHAILTENTWRGADMLSLMRDQLLVGEREDARISYSGPSATLDPQCGLHLALVVHELGTNARKYGALSVPNGHVSVKWVVRSDGEGCHLLLEWKERGGPAVVAPTARGFGTALIEQSLHAHGGGASIRYEAEGVTCNIRLPLPDGGRIGAYTTPRRTEGSHTDVHGSVVEHTAQGKRVLVVDDEPLVSMDAISTLNQAGHEVVGPAATVEKAMALIERGGFDVALLDANLAGRPVDSLATALKQRNIPFAFLTGYGRGSLPQAFRQAPLLSKPFTPQQLLKAVGSLTQGAEVIAFRQKN